MSETRQVKHPFKCIKPKNKDTKSIRNNKRSQAVEAFKEYLEQATKDKQNCYDNDHKRVLKSCNRILSLKDENNIPKLCILIGDLCISSSDFKNHYFKEVVGAGFAISTFMKSHNSRTYRPLASELNFVLYKHTIWILLGISIFKFNTITKNYGITARLEYGTKGITYDRLGIKVLKT